MAAEPPADLCDFLRLLKIPQHAAVMLALGFDDVDEFAFFEPEDVERMRTALLGKEVPAGHVDKIVRAVKARRPLPPAVYPSARGTLLPAAGTPLPEAASVSHGAGTPQAAAMASV